MNPRSAFVLLAALAFGAGAPPRQEEGDTCLMLIADNLGKGQANFYLYHCFSREKVSFEEGDRFEYEVFLPEGLPESKGGVDIWFEGGKPALRDTVRHGSRVLDQNGINAHGDGVLGPAVGHWYARTFPLDAVAGSRSGQWYLVSEGDRPGCYVQFVDRVRVRRASGEVISIYENGPPSIDEPGLVNGYSKYSTLRVVKRSLVEGAERKGELWEEVDRIKERGRRIAGLADLRTEMEVAQAVLEQGKHASAMAAVKEAAALLEELESAAEEPMRFQPLLAEILERLASVEPVMKQYQGHLVGHAHIDFQWLWEWPETLEVCRDTFGQAVRFMEEYEGYTFTQSSTALYAATEAHYPELFEKIRDRVAKGQWEIVGGRVCEGDEHMISSESHARHFLYGQLYFRERFGRDTKVGWEPDTFGHTAQMPQILRLGGCDAVYFCRGGDQIPLFWWEALDGTRVLAFEESATGTWYNAGVSRTQLTELRDFLARYRSPDTLWVYGVGDHGGGPTREHIESALEMRARPHNPKVAFSTAAAFFDAVREKADLEKIPTLRKELNSRAHAGFFGTYTSHGDVKRWNRDAEAAVESAEVLATAASFHGFPYPREAFRTIWEDITWNHHHDTLPGTSIHASYGKSRAMYEEAIERSRAIGRAALERIAGAGATPPGSGEGRALLVFNPLGWVRDGLATFDLEEAPAAGRCLFAVALEGVQAPVQVIREDGGWKGIFLAKALPSMGYRTYRIEERDGPGNCPLEATETGVENGRLRIEIDARSGSIESLVHKGSGKEFLKPGGSARLEVRLEKPHNMSAWVIGEFLPFHKEPSKEGVTVVERGPVRSTLRIESAFGASSIVQYVSLIRDCGWVEIRCEADWKEKGTPDRPAPFLKAVVDTAFEEAAAFYEVPFGVIARPADGEEVPALKWADLGTENMGLCIINDCKHGYSARGGRLTLSLIRSSYAPDPEADVGFHRFGYALYPHAGDWREGQAARRAAEFNRPVWVIDVPAGRMEAIAPERSYFSDPSPSVIATAVKRAEDDEGVIYRCYEAEGSEASLELQCFQSLKRAERVNFIEDVLGEADVHNGVLRDTLPPFRISTYKLRFDAP
jgi:alpha-mannosidase